MLSPEVVFKYTPAKPTSIVKFASAQGLEVIIQPRVEIATRKED
jgi:hypothetical protein